MIFSIPIDTSVIALLFSGIILPMITCVAIIIEKNGRPKLKLLLFAIFFGIIHYYLVNVFVITGLIRDFPFLLRGFVPFYYIVQPAIYFYVVVNLNENYTFSKKDLIHLIPALYSIIDNYGFYTGGSQHWQYWANSIADNFSNIPNYPGTIMKAKYNFVMRVVLYISYTFFAWRFYISNIQQNKEFKNQFILKWLKLFLIMISIFVVAVTFSTIYNSQLILSISDQPNLFLKLPLFITGISIITLATYILLNPILLYGLPKVKNLEILNDDQEPQTIINSPKIEIDEIIDNEYNMANSIISEIKEKQLYKNCTFSMAMASKYFSIPNHQISFIINKHIKKSFPDIISELRTDHAIQLLKDYSNKKYTMETIGKMSGFNSRTTFHVSFKKITGMSPNEYVKNLKVN
jgi:AraC-like DNA-binding protein